MLNGGNKVKCHLYLQHHKFWHQCFHAKCSLCTWAWTLPHPMSHVSSSHTGLDLQKILPLQEVLLSSRFFLRNYPNTISYFWFNCFEKHYHLWCQIVSICMCAYQCFIFVFPWAGNEQTFLWRTDSICTFVCLCLTVCLSVSVYCISLQPSIYVKALTAVVSYPATVLSCVSSFCITEKV